MTDAQAVQLWEGQLRLQAALFNLPTRRNQHASRQRSALMLNELFFDLLEVVEPDLFVEAGAFEGSASLRAATVGSGPSVIAFEANPENYRHFTAAQEFEARGVTYLNYALTDQAGPITFHLEAHEGSSILGYSSILERSDDAVWRPDTPTVPITVEGVRLDDHTPDAERVAMWVDVEGATDKVLAGAPKRLAACDLMKVEVEDQAYWEGQPLSSDIIATMLDAGLIPVCRDIENAHQYNIIFASARLLRQGPAIAAIETFLTAIQEPEAWPIVERARTHPVYGAASRTVRRAIGRS